MKRKWRFLLLCAAAVAALTGYFFLLPAPAVGEGFQLLEVRQDGRDLTASLRPEQLADLEATMRGASRFRWKNPIGVYPLEADTVMPTRKPRYAFAPPNTTARIMPRITEVGVSSGITLSAGIYGLNCFIYNPQIIVLCH